MSTYLDKMIRSFQKNDEKRDRGLRVPDDIRTLYDISYGNDPEQVLDVYLPKEESTFYPVLINVHGGGWVYGDKELYRYFCMEMARFGFAVINFSYRLAPKHKFPAQLIDLNKVVYWMLENKDNYHFDINNCFMLGDSAGAQLLGLYVDMIINKKYSDNFKFTPPKAFIPKAIAFNCGSFEPSFTASSFEKEMVEEVMAALLPFKGTKTEIELFSVIKNLNSKFPPSLFITAANDFLKEQTLLMTVRLVSLNIPFEFLFFGDKKEQLGHVFNLDIRNKEAKRCNKAIADFFLSFI